VNPQPSGGLQNMTFRIQRTSTTVVSFNINTVALSSSAATTATFVHIFDGPVAAATETFKVQLRADTNNTAVSSTGSAEFVRMLCVEDVGAV